MSGLKRVFLRLSFRNVSDLADVKKELLQGTTPKSSAASNLGIEDTSADVQAYLTDWNELLQGLRDEPIQAQNNSAKHTRRLGASGEWSELIADMREHDLPYHLRFCIDFGVRVGQWYEVAQGGCPPHQQLRLGVSKGAVRPDPVVLTFDIETYKAPLKFPDAAYDPIMMISYMLDGQVTKRRQIELQQQKIIKFFVSSFVYPCFWGRDF